MMTLLNSKLGHEAIYYLQYTPEAWIICALKDLPKNVSRIVKIVHSAKYGILDLFKKNKFG